MKTLLDNLSSLEWWIGVVLVGIGINIISALLKTRLDSYFGSVSLWWAKRSQAKRAKFEQAVSSLKNSPDEQVDASLVELRLRLICIRDMLMGVFCFLVGITMKFPGGEPILLSHLLPTILYFGGTLLFLYAIRTSGRATEFWEQILAARKGDRRRDKAALV